MARLAERVRDRRLLVLIGRMLEATVGMWDGVMTGSSPLDGHAVGVGREGAKVADIGG